MRKKTNKIDDHEMSAASVLKAIEANVVGQNSGLVKLAECAEVFAAGLSPFDRPAGVFLFLGPTGVGKTLSAEALAEHLHGSSKHLLRIDCGEFQLEHEVSRLIGAPPGYLGHRETPPLLSQQKINATMSANCSMSILLFDEIEKASPAMTRLLLGVLDKGILRLGDNNLTNFEKCLVVMTSNLTAGKLQEHFSPEFLNGVDEVITFNKLSISDLKRIAVMECQKMVNSLARRISVDLKVKITDEAADWLCTESASSVYGAREVRRTVQRHVRQPLARHVLLTMQKYHLIRQTVVVSKNGDGVKVSVK